MTDGLAVLDKLYNLLVQNPCKQLSIITNNVLLKF